MVKQNPPTALETRDCPPHRWDCDNKDFGHCLKCGVTKDFGKLLRRYERPAYAEAKARKGGQKRGERV